MAQKVIVSNDGIGSSVLVLDASVIPPLPPGGPTVWGTIIGTLSDQTDLQAALDAAGGGGITELTGDVTAGPGSGAQAAVIPNDAVTYAKIQNVSATDKLLGRSTAGAGNIEEIPCTTFARTMLDDVDAAAVRSTLVLGTLATQNGTFSGTSSGTNTGDQTAIANATLADMATKTYKGRTSGGTGDPEDVAVATLKTDLVLVKGDVGLGSVDNTADSAKPVSTATQTALDGKASTTHAASHQNGGSDEISVAGLSGLLADGQTPLAHKASHSDGGSDELVVTGLGGLLADGQTPLAHAVSHKSGGSDAVKLDELAAPTDITTLNATTALHGLMPKGTGSTTTFFRSDMTQATPVAAAGDTSKHLTSGTSTIVADTCRVVVRRYTIDSGAHLVIEATGSMEITA